jgi:hypothetical protein
MCVLTHKTRENKTLSKGIVLTSVNELTVVSTPPGGAENPEKNLLQTKAI